MYIPVKLPHVYVSIWKFQLENKQAEVVQLPRAVQNVFIPTSRNVM